MRAFKIIKNILYLKCSKCGKFKTKDNFSSKKSSIFNASSRCYDCTLESIKKRKYENIEKIREYGREYKRKDKTLSNKYKEKHISLNKKLGFNRLSFHQKANKYAKKYNLYPVKCPICGDNKKTVLIHHPNYNTFDNRKDVVFCCASCHRLIHNNQIQCPEPIDLLLINKND